MTEIKKFYLPTNLFSLSFIKGSQISLGQSSKSYLLHSKIRVKGTTMMRLKRHRASAIVISEGKLLGFRAEDPFNSKPYFFLPGGQIEEGESAEQTAIRETLEETGYRIAIAPQPRLTATIDFEWNGDLYESTTTFLLGNLVSNVSTFSGDADYHRGVAWVPVTELDQHFAYNQPILDAINSILRNRF